ncbi:hypothetical protein IAT38_001230 [Cryptococcus sp. DSM 104549]
MTAIETTTSNKINIAEFPGYTALAEQFKGDLLLPGDEGYDPGLKRWAATAERPAGLVAFVKDEKDIAAVLAFAKANRLEIAVKGGGHSVSGASSSDGGIVIDLSRYLRTVEVDPETRVAFVGGGATWRDVDLATTPHGLASVAGTVSHTGVGGLTLGGGYGYLTGEFGLVIDNLLGVTVISSDGEVHQASESENTDLFWAVRGGGGNFGVVTSFTLKLHPQRPEVFLGNIHFPGERVEEVFDAVREWLKIRSVKDLLFIFMEDCGDGPVVMAHVFHNGPLEDGQKQFKPFLDRNPIVNTTAMIPYLSLNIAVDDIRPSGTGLYWHGAIFPDPVTHPAAGPLMWSKYMEMVAAEPDFAKSTFSILEFHHPDKLTEEGKKRDMAFNCRGKQVNKLVGIGWDGMLGKEPMARAKKWAVDISQAAVGEVKDEPYPNWDSDTPTSFARAVKLFGPSYPRLQKIKARYDPDNMFRKWHPIEPKA